MTFTFTGSPLVQAPAHKIWLRLTDPIAVGNSGPGVQRVRVIDPHNFEVVTALKLAAFKLEFVMKVELFDLVPERELNMRARGKATGSSIEVLSHVTLEPVEEQRTRLHWNATTVMKGIVARVGGSRLEGLARELTERFWNRFITAVESA
jgi:carbon monoxide dehydrogenase subunit G